MAFLYSTSDVLLLDNYMLIQICVGSTEATITLYPDEYQMLKSGSQITTKVAGSGCYLA